jgi:hypothetical protein
VATLALSTTVAQAHIFDFLFGMVGSNVVPPSGSDAQGLGLFNYNHHSFKYDLDLFITGVSLDDLLGAGPNGTPLHIYHGRPGENGDIVMDPGFFGDFVQEADGIRLTLSTISIGGQQGAFESSIFANQEWLYGGELYIQLYTKQFPNGDIRGRLPHLGKSPEWTDNDGFAGLQGDPIPAPAPGAIACVPFGAWLAARRRRR